MEVPIKVAWCNLLFTSNGGRLTKRGVPIIRTEEDEARGLCNRAWDCHQCSILQSFVSEQIAEGKEAHWECTKCAYTEVPGMLKAVPGYYTSFLAEVVEHPSNTDNRDPTCSRCGEETPHLQLVLRVKG